MRLTKRRHSTGCERCTKHLTWKEIAVSDFWSCCEEIFICPWSCLSKTRLNPCPSSYSYSKEKKILDLSPKKWGYHITQHKSQVPAIKLLYNSMEFRKLAVWFQTEGKTATSLNGRCIVYGQQQWSCLFLFFLGWCSSYRVNATWLEDMPEIAMGE